MWRSTTRILHGHTSVPFRSVVKRQLCLATAENTEKRSRVLETAEAYKSGDKLSGYTVNKVSSISELDLVAVQLSHDATGAEHIHIAKDDSNNVFSVGLRTTPMDSTGVPHILEHVTLCGSRRYPCRDPFFAMTDRSLSTFMNAMTASDFTIYPFSTQNPKDYENLMRVYLDAVYFPNLRELDFWQEGWRLEHENVKDKSSPLSFKGVVFNEMKGALSDRDQLYCSLVQQHLLPSHTYGHLSGGDPLYIPDLSWEQLKQFHSTHYHPSNSRFYTYGDMPLERHLPLIEDLALKHFIRIDPNTEIPHEPRWTEPREVHLSCAPDTLAPDPDKQIIISKNYLLKNSRENDPFESFNLAFVIALMTSGPEAPFTRALVEPNIGAGYSPGVGFDRSTKDHTFSVGLENISKEDIPRVLEIIDQTFDKVIEEGFDEKRVKSILHTLELGLKHQTSRFGLSLISGMMSKWNHGTNPVEHLHYNKIVDQFKENVKSSERFLQDKVHEYFKDNLHCLTAVMSPDAEFEAKKTVKEQEKLASIVSKLTQEDKENIYKKGLELEEEQNKKPDVSCLPKMNLEDVERLTKRTELSTTYAGFVPVQICEQPTNGITYCRAISSITSLPEELKMYLPIFCSIITEVGAGNLDYRQMSQLIQQHTGGVSVSTHLSPHHMDTNSFEQGIFVSSHCLDENIPYMFSILQDVFTRPTIDDHERLRTLINMMTANMTNNIVSSGHAYAMSLAESNLTPLGDLAECLVGLEQVSFLKTVAEKEDLSELVENLTKIAVHVLDGTELRCSLNTTAKAIDPATNALVEFLDSLPGCRSDLPGLVTDLTFQPKHSKTHVEFPLPVNFVSRCIKTVPYLHEDNVKLSVLAKILSTKFLHRKIREQGGAYGGGARQSSGVFSCYSYRDPNSLETIQAFDEGAQWAADGKFEEDSIEEAKLSIFSGIDHPVAPGNKGQGVFSGGITDDMKQIVRDRLFAVTRDDLVQVAEKYLLPGKMVDSYAIIGPSNAAINQDQSWTVKKGSEIMME